MESVITNGGGNYLDIDSAGQAQVVAIEHAHQELHEGNHYHASTATSAVADNAYLDLAITAATGIEAHIVLHGAVGGDSFGMLYTGATVSGGTTVTSYNRNRNSDNTGGLTLKAGPTVTSTGTRIHFVFIPGGDRRSGGGGQARSEAEWILEAGVTYLARVRNVSGGTIGASITIEWYEE